MLRRQAPRSLAAFAAGAAMSIAGVPAAHAGGASDQGATPRLSIETPRATILTAERGVVGAGPAVDERVDPNASTSPFAGVASLFIGGHRLASGAAISRRHILTAAHCFDVNADGRNETGSDVAIIFNTSDGAPVAIPSAHVERVSLHPDFTGFGNPGVNDDLAIITLARPLPPSIPTYTLSRAAIRRGSPIRMVGYGETGDGERGYQIGSGFFTTKRLGANAADVFFLDDEGTRSVEIWQFDFDAPLGDGFAGGPSLGENVEATLGFGDSGGPGFLDTPEGLRLVSVNNYVSGPGEAGRFGSGGGGVLVSAYEGWIRSVTGDAARFDGRPARPADISRDGRVDRLDLLRLLANWNSTTPEADVNADGLVNGADLAALIADWDG